MTERLVEVRTDRFTATVPALDTLPPRIVLAIATAPSVPRQVEIALDIFREILSTDKRNEFDALTWLETADVLNEWAGMITATTQSAADDEYDRLYRQARKWRAIAIATMIAWATTIALTYLLP